jgi:hypothetical protein
MKFSTWLESRQFKRLIPDNVLALVPALKAKAQELNQAYAQGHMKPFVSFTKIDDPFYPGKKVDIGFITREEAKKRKLLIGQGVVSSKPLPETGERICYYAIPISGFDTIYHELVHVFDPKVGKGLSKSAWSSGFQSMDTPHEVDANISGFIDIMKEKLEKTSPTKRNDLIKELKDWLRNPVDLDPWAMPELLRTTVGGSFMKGGKNRHKFLTSIYNALAEYL